MHVAIWFNLHSGNLSKQVGAEPPRFATSLLLGHHHCVTVVDLEMLHEAMKSVMDPNVSKTQTF